MGARLPPTTTDLFGLMVLFELFGSSKRGNFFWAAAMDDILPGRWDSLNLRLAPVADTIKSTLRVDQLSSVGNVFHAAASAMLSPNFSLPGA
jgi:hypothetical protein